LDAGQEVLRQRGGSEKSGVMSQNAEENTPLGVLTNPADGVIGVRTRNMRTRNEYLALVHIRFLDVQTEKNMELIARIRRVRKTEILVLIEELLAGERCRERAIGIIHFHPSLLRRC